MKFITQKAEKLEWNDIPPLRDVVNSSVSLSALRWDRYGKRFIMFANYLDEAPTHGMIDYMLHVSGFKREYVEEKVDWARLEAMGITQVVCEHDDWEGSEGSKYGAAFRIANTETTYVEFDVLNKPFSRRIRKGEASGWIGAHILNKLDVVVINGRRILQFWANDMSTAMCDVADKPSGYLLNSQLYCGYIDRVIVGHSNMRGFDVTNSAIEDISGSLISIQNSRFMASYIYMASINDCRSSGGNKDIRFTKLEKCTVHEASTRNSPFYRPAVPTTVMNFCDIFGASIKNSTLMNFDMYGGACYDSTLSGVTMKESDCKNSILHGTTLLECEIESCTGGVGCDLISEKGLTGFIV